MIRPLTEADAEALAGLRRVSLLDIPLAFASSPEDDFAASIDLVRAHLWGMYVAPDHRGRGLGLALLRATLDHARSLPGVTRVHLSVSSAAPRARRLYERAGFELWGTEPDALRDDGESVTDYHMALHFD
jgi:RimJ/RimL family protein N-acetyltransferase